MTGDGACQLGCPSKPVKDELVRTAYSVTKKTESRTMGYSKLCTHVWCVHFLKDGHLEASKQVAAHQSR